VSAGRGTLIGYATGGGDTAADGAARNSPFTTSLLRHLEEPGLEIRELLRRVRSDLASGGSRQLSETADRLSGQFYFRPPEPKAEAPGRPAPQQPSLADLPDYVVWKGIENSVQPADYEFFLKTHPQSQLRGLAEDRLRRLMAGLGMSVEVVPAKPSAPPPPEPLTVPEGKVAARPTTPRVAGDAPSVSAQAATDSASAVTIGTERPQAGAAPAGPVPRPVVGGRPPSTAQKAEQQIAALPLPAARPAEPAVRALPPPPPSAPADGEAVRVGPREGVLRAAPARNARQLTPPLPSGATLTAGRRQRGFVEVWSPDGRYGWLGEGAIEKARRPRAPGEVFRDCPDATACPELVAVAPGAFVMGSPSDEPGRDDDEGPPRELALAKPLAVGRFEVTFAEWDACVAGGGCGGHRPDDRGWGRDRRPVIDVSFDDAQAYLAWLSGKTGQRYRLLGEAEWEYVARAGDRGPNPWGDQDARACRFASLHDEVGRERNGSDWAAAGCSDGHAQTAPVGGFAPNAWGLHDILGNVAEWTADCWVEDLAGLPHDGAPGGAGDCSSRALRGGSWQEYLDGMRYAARSSARAATRTGYDGFRVARDLDEGLAGPPPAATAGG
jgi:formylglycine-generating enzyme required for sulfatase activity